MGKDNVRDKSSSHPFLQAAPVVSRALPFQQGIAESAGTSPGQYLKVLLQFLLLKGPQLSGKSGIGSMDYAGMILAFLPGILQVLLSLTK